ncbi:MAG: hypothetical protein QOH06_1683 [Acidobacteriota bacterium]|jgi:hypothetical protein|nr:hypothetical protein [Acidobacteriota bacterium]
MIDNTGDVRLVAVEVFPNYLSLQFDGDLFVSRVCPTILLPNREIHFDEPGYFDILWEQIGLVIAWMNSQPDGIQVIHLKDGAALRCETFPEAPSNS